MAQGRKVLTLGEKVRDHLLKLGIETPVLNGVARQDVDEEISSHFREIMKLMLLNMEDDSLSKTPDRVAKMYSHELFWGLNYTNFPSISTFENKMRYDEMVTARCTVMSLCEHHFVPFIGVAHIAYIPNTKVLGLSKFNRVVDFFARRPQIQERLTEQVSATLKFVLDCEDVAVVIKAEHFCVKLRGVKDAQSETTTSRLAGRFFSNPSLRAEFLALTR